MNNLDRWLIGLKTLLWISVIGFGLTLYNAVYLVISSDHLRAEVRLKQGRLPLEKVDGIQLNSGTFVFESANIIDRIVFRHTPENWDFPQSLFAFLSCALLLYVSRSVSSQNPFNLRTANAIRLMGLVFIGYGLINVVAAYYMRLRVGQLTKVMDLRYISFPSDLTYLKSGVFILIFSLIYRMGVVYQEEARLTI
ncbi:hypothetical protein [Mucilaginibacter sp. CSA2-8R]|uniref:hypothetical protein n=1 Tax=Mucilaginibacter sp. CSA2-8R TaxID=3141542 RepID=UPI00315D3A9A